MRLFNLSTLMKLETCQLAVTPDRPSLRNLRPMRGLLIWRKNSWTRRWKITSKEYFRLRRLMRKKVKIWTSYRSSCKLRVRVLIWKIIKIKRIERLLTFSRQPMLTNSERHLWTQKWNSRRAMERLVLIRNTDRTRILLQACMPALRSKYERTSRKLL